MVPQKNASSVVQPASNQSVAVMASSVQPAASQSVAQAGQVNIYDIESIIQRISSFIKPIAVTNRHDHRCVFSSMKRRKGRKGKGKREEKTKK